MAPYRARGPSGLGPYGLGRAGTTTGRMPSAGVGLGPSLYGEGVRARVLY